MPSTPPALAPRNEFRKAGQLLIKQITKENNGIRPTMASFFHDNKSSSRPPNVARALACRADTRVGAWIKLYRAGLAYLALTETYATR